MMFYRVQISLHTPVPDAAGQQEAEMNVGDQIRQIEADSTRFWDLEHAFFPFVSDMRADRAYVGVASERNLTSGMLKAFLKAVALPYTGFTAEEISFAACSEMMKEAARREYISSEDDLQRRLNLRRDSGWCIELEEYIAQENRSEAQLVGDARDLLSMSLTEEVERIFSAPNTSEELQAHPVHYLIEGGSDEFRMTAAEILVAALFQANRVRSRRFTFRGPEDDPFLDFDESVEFLYRQAAGGTMVMYLDENKDSEHSMSFRPIDKVQLITGTLKRHHDDVLTILQTEKLDRDLRTRLETELEGCTIVVIREDSAEREAACRYLRNRAESQHVPVDDSLYEEIAEDATYTPTDLNEIYEDWKRRKLRTVIYPQYAGVSSFARTESVRKQAGRALDELQEMIGLESVKERIQSLLNFFQIQKTCRDRGLRDAMPCMHMVFTGNPGTAKTSVARLFAQIMKENGVLPEGGLVEVGRSELVGKYVGWTATIVKEKFRQARGGVLFIDEAYSLVDDRQGLYGDEAISTIVQEMENAREDTVVIFAGYQDRMADFLSTNPGLRSRIASHITFEDYTVEQLLDILELHAGREKLILADGVRGRVRSLLQKVRSEKDFGNGRYMRTLLEHARMRQATRLVTEDLELLSDDELRTLRPEDFETVPTGDRRKKNAMGFAS